MVLCLGEPLVRFLWCWLLLFIPFCSSFCCCSSFIHRLLYHATGTLPWHLRSVKASTSSELYPGSFWLPFAFSSTANATVLSGHFLLTGVFFALCFFHNISCVYQGLPGSRQFFLEVFRDSCWSSKQRIGPSVCLIDSNPPWSYSEEFIFKFYQILSWITCGKSLVCLLLTRFKIFSLVQSHMSRLLNNSLSKACNASITSKLFLKKQPPGKQSGVI